MATGNSVGVKIKGIGRVVEPIGVEAWQLYGNECDFNASSNKPLREIDLFSFAQGSMIWKVVLNGNRVNKTSIWLCYKPNGSLVEEDGFTLVKSGQIVFKYVSADGKPAGPDVRVRLFGFADARLEKVKPVVQ